MPSSLTYPGVYIEEIPSGVRTITGVATSIAAFVGFTAKGTPDVAQHITSFADFERRHGGLHRDSPVSYAVRQFFANGGTEAYVVRVASGHALARWQLADGSGTVLEVAAASPGLWANAVRLEVTHAGTRNPDADFNLIVSQLIDVGGTSQAVQLETHRNLNLNPQSPNYVESVINHASQVIRVSETGGLVYADQGFAVSQAIAFPLTVSDNVIAGTVDGDTAFSLTLPATPGDMSGLVTALNTAISDAGLAARLLAEESGLDGDTGGTGSLRLASLATGASSTVAAANDAFGGLAATIGFGLANGGREVTGAAEHRPDEVADVAPSTLGADGSRGGATELIGSPSAKSGIYALRDVDLFNLLCIPETRDLPEAQAGPVIQAAVALCEQERAFYIVDAVAGRNLTDIAAWASGVSTSRNAAVYFPAIVAADPLDAFRQRAMAPSGAIAGVYARTDATRGVWKAPAGTDATLNGTAGLSAPMNDIENGTLNPQGINALRSFPVYGRIIWGARTLRGADAQADEYKYIPVRRLVLFLEESLYRGTQWVVFEPNDEPLWAQIRLNLGAFMQTLFRQGAFQGASPRDAYFVKCDGETTTQNDIDRGVVNILVGFAPLKPAEFVVIQIQQIAGQVAV